MTEERFALIVRTYEEWCELHPADYDICARRMPEWDAFYRSRGIEDEEIEDCEFQLQVLCDRPSMLSGYCKDVSAQADIEEERPTVETSGQHGDNMETTSVEPMPDDLFVEDSVETTIYDIKGAAFASYNWYKAGCNERIYEVGMQIELRDKGYDAQRQVPLPVYYKGEKTDVTLRMDLVVFGTDMGDIILELKALPFVTDEHRYQLFSYMRQTATRYGMLINFSTDTVFTELWEYDADTNRMTAL